MTLKEALHRASHTLITRHIPDALQEAQILLRHTLQLTSAQLYLHLEQELTSEQWQTFWNLVERRLQNEPVAYLTGHQEFYGLDLYVDRRVLIPRPESELLVETALDFTSSYITSKRLTIADIGTGSGAIALSLAKNLPYARVHATDLSAAALEVASINCTRHGLSDRVVLLQGNLLEPLPERVDIVVANLPYIKEAEFEMLAPEIHYEPQIALYGGPEGLEQVSLLLQQARSRLQPRACIALEIARGQTEKVGTLTKGYFPEAKIEIHHDLGGIERVLCVIL